jgi:hypothetical protein
LDLSPLGSYKAIIRRRTTDLLGGSAWICKEVVPFIENEHNKNEVKLSHELFDKLKKIDEEMLETPSNRYQEMERLSAYLNMRARREAPEIFIYENMMKKNDHHYLINFSYRGQGVEAPGSRRIEQFTIDLNYNPKTGLIRSWGYEISSPTNQHKWEVCPSEWDEHFAPSQSKEEICNAIMSAFSTY